MTETYLNKKIKDLSEEEKHNLKLKLITLLKTNYAKKPTQLAAYIESNKSIDYEDFKFYLKKRLPSYMIPNNIYELSSVPRLPNGKIDKKALISLVGDAKSEEEVRERLRGLGYLE